MVRDASTTTSTSSDDQAAGEAINVGTGAPTTVAQVDAMLRARLHPDRADDPKLQPKITGQFRAGDIRHCFADTGRLGALGYEPKVRFEDGIAELVDWVRSQQADDSFEGARMELASRGLTT